MPATANVTVASRGEVLHPLVQRAIVINHWRLVMSVSSTRNQITKLKTASAFA